MKWRKLILILVAVAAATFLLIQFLPIGRAQGNPEVVAEPNWNSPETRQMAERACFDCHSNETDWPWFASIAPMSWIVQKNVTDARSHFNFSDWNQSHEGHDHEAPEPADFVEVLREGKMPPAPYLLTHPGARLTDAERAALGEGLRATAEQSSTAEQAEGEEHEEDETHDEGETHDEEEATVEEDPTGPGY
jgi:hypothetical protein